MNIITRDAEEPKEGLVVRVTGSEVWVESGSETLSCMLRGRFRRSGGDFQVVAGDRVVFRETPGAAGRGVIEEVLPRTCRLSRWDPRRGGGERVVVANLDLLFVIASLRQPAINYRFVDRVLASAGKGEVRAIVCLNKIDLALGSGEIAGFVRIYQACGYEILTTSALTGRGMDRLAERICGGIYAFVGESGVGKSSILKRIEPALDLKIASVAEKTGRGKHTTTYSQLYKISGGYVADTPGMQNFGFPGDDVLELAATFPEFEDRSTECKFSTCTHSHEPGCAVKEALASGAISRSRYESYLALLSEVGGRKRPEKG